MEPEGKNVRATQIGGTSDISAGQIMDMGMKDEETAADIIDKSEQLIFRISEQRGTKGFTHIGEVVKTNLAMLDELKKRGVKRLKVLYSKEEPIKNSLDPRTPMSISFVPSAAGLIIAGEVIKDLCGISFA